MNTLNLMATDFDNGRYTKGALIYGGSVEIASELGRCFFPSIKVTGDLRAGCGTSIEVDRDLEAGRSIKAGWGISAGGNISAGWSIKTGGGLKAGMGIKAGGDIDTGGDIDAGAGLEAGWNIDSGGGIRAGMSIKCKSSLSALFRIFAGTILYRTPTDEEQTISCGHLAGGMVAYGTLVEVEAANPNQISA